MKWEYFLTITSEESFAENLNVWGEQGWELVYCQCIPHADDWDAYECIFKRPLA